MSLISHCHPTPISIPIPLRRFRTLRSEDARHLENYDNELLKAKLNGSVLQEDDFTFFEDIKLDNNIK
jgi:hypothetical protein